MSETAGTLSLKAGERDHMQGLLGAAITLVEYGDYECPYCGQAYPILKELQQLMGDRLCFIFRNFPLAQMHPHAQIAAEAAEVAGAHDKFWEMHDMLYENQKALGMGHLKQYADKIGLDGASFAQELQEHTAEGRVHEDFLSGVRSGVNGTPAFFINGVRHDGSYDLQVLRAALERSLD